MVEFVVWLLLGGISITLAGMWIRSRQIKKHMKDTAEINLLILEELKRLTPPARPVETDVGVMLERRCKNRRARAQASRAGFPDQRRSPGRRWEDFASVM